MLRRVRVITTFLLLGAVVNVAVAWGGASFSRATSFLIERPGRHDWPVTVPSHWPDSPTVLTVDGMLWTNVRYHVTFIEYTSRDGENQRVLLVDGPVEDTVIDVEAFLIDRYIFGWPSRALGFDRWEEFSLDVGSAMSVNRIDGHPPRSTWHDGIRTGYGFGFLPLQPHWPGFLINTLIFAAALWLLIPGSLSLRRVLRRKRRLCAACAYPVGVSPVCTECGAAITPTNSREAAR